MSLSKTKMKRVLSMIAMWLVTSLTFQANAAACARNILTEGGTTLSSDFFLTIGFAHSILYDEFLCPYIYSPAFPALSQKIGEPLSGFFSPGGGQTFQGLNPNGNGEAVSFGVTPGSMSTQHIRLGIIDQRGYFWIAETTLSGTGTQSVSGPITFRLTDLTNTLDILDLMPPILSAIKTNQ